jgi:hypothetical protein
LTVAHWIADGDDLARLPVRPMMHQHLVGEDAHVAMLHFDVADIQAEGLLVVELRGIGLDV